MAELRDAIRASPIKVWLVRPSRERFDITAQPDFTVSKLKKTIDSVYGFLHFFQSLITYDADGAPVEMRNAKKIFSYNIQSDGDEIYFIMTGGNNIPTPVADEAPAIVAEEIEVAVESSGDDVGIRGNVKTMMEMDGDNYIN